MNEKRRLFAPPFFLPRGSAVVVQGGTRDQHHRKALQVCQTPSMKYRRRGLPSSLPELSRHDADEREEGSLVHRGHDETAVWCAVSRPVRRRTVRWRLFWLLASVGAVWILYHLMGSVHRLVLWTRSPLRTVTSPFSYEDAPLDAQRRAQLRLEEARRLQYGMTGRWEPRATCGDAQNQLC